MCQAKAPPPWTGGEKVWNGGATGHGLFSQRSLAPNRHAQGGARMENPEGPGRYVVRVDSEVSLEPLPIPSSVLLEGHLADMGKDQVAGRLAGAAQNGGWMDRGKENAKQGYVSSIKEGRRKKGEERARETHNMQISTGNVRRRQSHGPRGRGDRSPRPYLPGLPYPRKILCFYDVSSAYARRKGR